MAQTETATISGHIVDSSGAIVRDAAVELQSVQRGTSSTTTTNQSGIYIFPSVLPGQYSVTVRKEGFKQVDLVGVAANVQAHIEQNFRLEIGSTSESVTVNGEGTSINTTDASVSTVIDRQFAENLPLNGRSFQSLLYLTPGVNLNAGGGGNGAEGTTGQFVVNGQRGDANYWMVDGVSANVALSPSTPGGGASGAVGATNAVGGTSAIVSVDALQEFRIQTSTFAPEFGRTPGGQISIQTRSGANQFHGAVFDYLRNTVLDATDWYSNHYSLGKAAEIQNDFGGVLGGPLLRKKTFFFFSYEGLRVRQPYTLVATVPTLAARAGAIPAMRPFLDMFPLPALGAAETTPGSGIAPYTATFSDPSKADVYSLRVDHQLFRNLSLFARYSHAPSSVSQRSENGTAAANDVAILSSVTKSATIGATWTGSDTVVDDLRLNYSVGGGKQTFITDTYGGGIPFPAIDIFPSPYSYKNAGVDVITGFGTAIHSFQGTLAANYQHQYNLVDTLSVQRGAHSLKFGVDYRRLTPSYGQAPYFLLPIFSTLADMQAGRCYCIVSTYANGRFLLQNLGVFGQDTWRINSRLNVTYGLRWDVDFVPQSESGIALPGVNGFSLTDLSNLSLAPIGTSPYKTHYGNVAPRVGGAYRVSMNPDWGLVLRGGFGVFYGMASTEAVNGNAINTPDYPFGTNAYYPNGHFPTSPTDPQAAAPPVTPPNIANGNALFGMDPNLNSPYALQWNVALEQSLGKAQSLSLSYIGASDKRLLAAENISNPNANYASALLVAGTGTLNYSAMQLEFQRRLSRGLQALVSYSWSHGIDNGSYGNYSNGAFANIDSNRGDSDYDLRNTFSAALTYQFPTLRNNLVTRAITSGWSTDNIVQLRSGPPVDIQDANFTALSHTSASIVIRPDVVPGQPAYLTGSQYPGGKALNPAAFRDPPTVFDPGLGMMVPSRQGNLSRNARRALGLKQWDFGLHRDFPIYDRLKLQFRAELFNLLNHPNFSSFNNQFLTGNTFFGQSTQMLNQSLGGIAGQGGQNPLYAPGGPRSGELALKLVF